MTDFIPNPEPWKGWPVSPDLADVKPIYGCGEPPSIMVLKDAIAAANPKPPMAYFNGRVYLAEEFGELLDEIGREKGSPEEIAEREFRGYMELLRR